MFQCRGKSAFASGVSPCLNSKLLISHNEHTAKIWSPPRTQDELPRGGIRRILLGCPWSYCNSTPTSAWLSTALLAQQYRIHHLPLQRDRILQNRAVTLNAVKVNRIYRQLGFWLLPSPCWQFLPHSLVLHGWEQRHGAGWGRATGFALLCLLVPYRQWSCSLQTLSTDHFWLGGGGAGGRLTHSILAGVQQGTSSKLCGTVITQEKKVSVFFSQNVPWLFGECELMLWQDLSSL